MISLIEAYKRIYNLKQTGYQIPDDKVSAIFFIPDRDKLEKEIEHLERQSKNSRI